MSQTSSNELLLPTSCNSDERQFFMDLAASGSTLLRPQIERTFSAHRRTLAGLISYASFSDELYTRVPVCRTKHFEAILFGWLPGQRSPIHNHLGSVCGMYIAQGTATEISFTPNFAGLLYPSRTQRVPAGSITVAEDADLHMVANVDAEPLVTLHVYSPPLTGMEVFSLESSVFGGYDELLAKKRTPASNQISLVAN